MSRQASFLVCALGAGFQVGCGDGASGEYLWEMAPGISTTIALESDGTAVVSTSPAGQSATGRYEVDGDRVTIIMSDTDRDVFNIDGDGNLSKTEHGATIVWVKQ